MDHVQHWTLNAYKGGIVVRELRDVGEHGLVVDIDVSAPANVWPAQAPADTVLSVSTAAESSARAAAN